jgi:hypothetical protein
MPEAAPVTTAVFPSSWRIRSPDVLA